MASGPTGSVRIIAGRWRGRRITVPTGLALRPTGDRAREALFSILGPVLESAAVLDLFCGTGVLGLEALSRGARRVVAIDSEARAVRALSEVAALLGASLAEHATIREEALRWLRTAPVVEPFDLVFADPPWQRDLGAEVIRAVGSRPWIRPGGIVVLEREAGRAGPSLPPGGPLVHLRTAQYGRAVFELFRRSAST